MQYSLIMVLMLCMSTHLQADCNSLIIAPKIGSTITRPQPIIIGIMNNNEKKPYKKKPVTVYADQKKIGTVVTNKYGVWSYRPTNNQAFMNGMHFVQAFMQPTTSTFLWAQGTFFTVQLLERQPLYKSGNVSTANSSINFPFDSGYINTATPTIVGSLLDANYNPVEGETVTIKVDNLTVGSPTSDGNGVFSYALSASLSDGTHTITAHCVESSVDLTAVSFTVDTVAPATPVIATPAANSTVTTHTFTVTGTCESYATVTTYLDGDIYGQICYADETGAWSAEYTADNGAHSLTAQASDMAENQSPLSSPRLFTVNA